MKKYKRQITLIGINGDKILVTEISDNKTAVDIGKMVSFLPLGIDQSIEFMRKIGLIK
ncbi:hypothetical protein IX317_001664 [Fusobacterium sp. DD29]|uniref:hypothetical protein n=1 Tax=unclassified Fusobacterium TaxID=2648384 RepID=UPI001B8ADCBE|nr:MULTISPECIES: hypothetical protein [unclassified Fusobacterium]MBR8749984.1 hypothetical protein [Fusobacterium sp. DD29]MBR8762203.1 hypothetical protein [Fusobacterium sp. DD25]MBR8768243.1 hypothetical protein [Fusobacterium sp. DD43]MBR8772319.1 hypothetical protein [Fusobacterium sp. DD40]MBR8776538.1 hypothetical protein [Fusobacterium sp. DD17]